MEFPVDILTRELVGLPVQHVDGARGSITSVESSGRVLIRFKGGVKTHQPMHTVLVQGVPLNRYLANKDLWIDRETFLEDLKSLLQSERYDDADKFVSRWDWVSQAEYKAMKRDVRVNNAKARTKALARQDEFERIQKVEHEKRETQRRREAMRPYLEEYAVLLDEDFLNADSLILQRTSDISQSLDLRPIKIEFIQEWFRRLMDRLRDRSGGTHEPDDEQAAAIGAVDGHVHVVARAGSGKTATLVNRAIFLIKHCRIDPGDILILAFNRKAVQEVRKRVLIGLHSDAAALLDLEAGKRDRKAGLRSRPTLSNQAGNEDAAVSAVAESLNARLPHVMTFHALAYALVHPEQSILYDDTDKDGSQGQSRVIQQIIDDYLREPESYKNIRQIMMMHFRADWERIISGGYERSKDEFLEFRRSLPHLSLNGIHVKSHGEKVIANFLFEHGVEYNYEQNHWWSGINYRPDFTVPFSKDGGVVIEYFGLKGDPDYDNMSKQKREYWIEKDGWELIELYPEDVRDPEALEVTLRSRLEGQGINCRRLSEEEIWTLIGERAVDHFTKAMTTFIARCRTQMISPDELGRVVSAFVGLSEVELRFIGVAQIVYETYLDRIEETDEEDFNGLIQRAARLVDNGESVFRRKNSSGDVAALRYVFIDEFQDFTPLFNYMLEAIQRRNRSVELFCVGDDWQAINGFAGSDLRFFNEFPQRTGKVDQLYLTTNYRSARSIVEVGNALMAGYGHRAKAHREDIGKVFLAELDAFYPTQLEKEKHRGDVLTPSVVRLVAKGLDKGKDVVLLARRNGLTSYVNLGRFSGTSNQLEGFLLHVRDHFPSELRNHITASTVHKYKGMEQKIVIALDVVEQGYPLIHPSWVFNRVLGETLEGIVSEERRLLYVALTRAVDELVIVTDSKNRSPFLKSLARYVKLPLVEWGDYPPPLVHENRFVIKVGNRKDDQGAGTYPVKDLLKAAGYQWRSSGWRSWQKVVLANDFSVEMLMQEHWAKAAKGVEIIICDESDAAIEAYEVNSGECVRKNVNTIGGKAN